MNDHETTATRWHAHLRCGCWITFLAKPDKGHLVHCGGHGIQPVMTAFVRDDDDTGGAA